MFTPLNLGFDGSLQSDQRFFPASGAAPSGSRDTASFAISLDTSLRAQAAGGEILPPDGGALPPVLDLSMQVAAIEEHVSAISLEGGFETAQQPISPAVATPGQGEETGSETLAAALEFMLVGARQPQANAADDAGSGNAPTQLDGTTLRESATTGLVNTTKPEQPVSPQPATVTPQLPPRPVDAGERRTESSRTPGHLSVVSTPADALEGIAPTDNDAAPDPRVAELRLSQLAPGAPDPAIRPAAGTGPAVDLPVELPVYRPAAAALPEAAVATETTATASVSSAESAQKASPRAPALAPIATPVGQSDWGESLSERVLVMTSGKLGNAEIRLTPAELGPVRVQVSVDDGTATVSFQASHATTREAIEQALPRLRDMLTENGLSLGQASVGDQGVHNGSREAADDPTGAEGAVVEAGDEAVLDPPAEVEARRVSSALVDTFA